MRKAPPKSANAGFVKSHMLDEILPNFGFNMTDIEEQVKWLAILCEVRTRIISANGDIFIPELSFYSE